MTSSIVWLVLIYGWIASEIFIGISTRTKRSSGNVRDRGSLLILWIGITLGMTASSLIGETRSPNMFGGAYWSKLASAILVVIGLGIRWTAIVTLGKSFSSNVAIQKKQKLTSTGLFRFVRHPSYLGLLLVFLAVALHSDNWIGFAAALIPTTAALLYRIHVEETALIAAFGEEYVAYSRKTKRLIPGLY